MYIIPMVLTVAGILLIIPFALENAVNFFHFIYSVAYVIAWGILFVFAPKYRSRGLLLFYLIWWFCGLLCAMTQIFSLHLTYSVNFDLLSLPLVLFLCPLAGLAVPFSSAVVINFLFGGIAFFFFVVALCENLVFRQGEEEREVE